jgi:lipopolysaccharide/colanic/teichoic acid biosynthesis glycosyltransferase
MFNKIRASIESGFFAFLFFAVFTYFYYWLIEKWALPRESILAVTSIITAHYITAIFCGYWSGWRARHDGWLYSILGYALFRYLSFRYNVHAPLPFPLHIRYLGYIPVLALLMFGAAIGEQQAHTLPASEQKIAALYPAVKRLIDLTISLTGILLLAPIMLAIAIGIKLNSPGPIFFHQRRIGQHGRVINIIKFRTMNTDGDTETLDISEILGKRLEKEGERKDQLVKLKEDARVFAFGRFLRQTSLDELPQLINIARGEMSLVGPRPLIPAEVERATPEELKRLEVKPGLTGWAQINGRGDLTFKERLKLDLEYVEKQSLWLDLKILLKTVWMVLSGRGAY